MLLRPKALFNEWYKNASPAWIAQRKDASAMSQSHHLHQPYSHSRHCDDQYILPTFDSNIGSVGMSFHPPGPIAPHETLQPPGPIAPHETLQPPRANCTARNPPTPQGQLHRTKPSNPPGPIAPHETLQSWLQTLVVLIIMRMNADLVWIELDLFKCASGYEFNFLIFANSVFRISDNSVSLFLILF